MSLIHAFQYLLKGGPVMYPLFACALLSVVVMIERAVFLSRASADGDALLDRVRAFVTEGRNAEAVRLCESTRGPVAALVAGGLRSQHLDAASIERSMEELALREMPILSRRLGALDTIITIAPLLGLLGTVTGMIKAFKVVGGGALSDQSFQITGGVAEALIATATGLAIAIVTLIGYNALTERVKEIIAEMETRGTQLMNILASARVKTPEGTATSHA